MALHDPVEDALNDRKKRARLVEAGAAVGTPGEDALSITRRFMEGNVPPIEGRRTPPVRQQVGGRQLPSQAAAVARRRAFGSQGARRRRGSDLIEPVEIPRYVPPGNFDPDQLGPRGDLSEQFFDLPGPVGFSRTPQGRSILKRILGMRGLR